MFSAIRSRRARWLRRLAFWLLKRAARYEGQLRKAQQLGHFEFTDDRGTHELEVYLDPLSQAPFAVDASFLDQVQDSVPSLYNPPEWLDLSEDSVA